MLVLSSDPGLLTPSLEDTSSQTILPFLSDHVISFSDWDTEPAANKDHNLSA